MLRETRAKSVSGLIISEHSIFDHSWSLTQNFFVSLSCENAFDNRVCKVDCSVYKNLQANAIRKPWRDHSLWWAVWCRTVSHEDTRSVSSLPGSLETSVERRDGVSVKWLPSNNLDSVQLSRGGQIALHIHASYRCGQGSERKLALQTWLRAMRSTCAPRSNLFIMQTSVQWPETSTPVTYVNYKFSTVTLHKHLNQTHWCVHFGFFFYWTSTYWWPFCEFLKSNSTVKSVHLITFGHFLKISWKNYLVQHEVHLSKPCTLDLMSKGTFLYPGQEYRGPEPIPAVMREEAGYTLNKSIVHYRDGQPCTHILTQHISLYCGRTAQHLQKTLQLKQWQNLYWHPMWRRWEFNLKLLLLGAIIPCSLIFFCHNWTILRR